MKKFYFLLFALALAWPAWGATMRDVKCFGATGNGTTDDSAAIKRALQWVTTPVTVGSETSSRSLFWPDGNYLITTNNWIGDGFTNTSSTYSGRLDVSLVGSGRNSSKIIFKPATANAACYNQKLTTTKLINGLSIEKLGFVFDNSSNGSQPIHFFITEAASGSASQNFRFSNSKFVGVSGSIFLELCGDVNEDMISGFDVLIDGYHNIIKSETNYQALIHNFYALDLLNITGHAFHYTRGGGLSVYGCNAIMTGTTGVDTAVIHLGGGTTSQIYQFNNLRTELRGANTRVITMVESENTVIFNSCNFSANITNNQAWAKLPWRHHSSIAFRDCVLPLRSSAVEQGSIMLIDSPPRYYATQNSQIIFDNCAPSGDRSVTPTAWPDYSNIDPEITDYSDLTVKYINCIGIANN